MGCRGSLFHRSGWLRVGSVFQAFCNCGRKTAREFLEEAFPYEREKKQYWFEAFIPLQLERFSLLFHGSAGVLCGQILNARFCMFLLSFFVAVWIFEGRY